MTQMRLAIVSAVTVLLLGCATARTPPPTLIAELNKARSLLNEGCYRCLEDALATYERLSVARNAPPDVLRGAFDAAVLLLMRAKEIGLPDEALLERARQRAALVPPVPGAVPPAAYFDAIALVSGETLGFDPEERERRGRDRRALWPSDGSVPPARERLTPAVATDIAAQYAALAVDCDDARLRKQVSPGEILKRFNVPLIRYRLALCGFAVDQFSFTGLRESDPRWIETFFFDGRREALKHPAPDLGKAADFYVPAHDAFPESTAITMALAHARNSLTEYETALGLFDGVLARYATHRDAMLGRVMSLSYLGRYYDAIAAATRMIDLGTYHMGDAYYWRAWNRYNVHDLPAAWDDVERATKLMVNTAVYTLAGFIAYARTELDTAIDRFAQAYKLDRTNCEAVSAEGLVHVDKQNWASAGPRFATSVECLADAAAQARRDMTLAEAADLAPNVKAKRVATLQKQIDTSEHRRAQSAFNAASAYGRLSHKAEALTHVEIAAEHPLLKEKAAALKLAIEKIPR